MSLLDQLLAAPTTTLAPTPTPPSAADKVLVQPAPCDREVLTSIGITPGTPAMTMQAAPGVGNAEVLTAELQTLPITTQPQPPAAIEHLRRHLLGVVEAVRAVEIDVGFALPLEQDIAQADLSEMLTIARSLSVGVCEVLR